MSMEDSPAALNDEATGEKAAQHYGYSPGGMVPVVQPTPEQADAAVREFLRRHPDLVWLLELHTRDEL